MKRGREADAGAAGGGHDDRDGYEREEQAAAGEIAGDVKIADAIERYAKDARTGDSQCYAESKPEEHRPAEGREHRGDHGAPVRAESHADRDFFAALADGE